MKISIDKITIQRCTPSCIDEILKIQSETFAELEEADILRSNSEQMLRECLFSPHITIGAWYDEKLVAFSILYFPSDDVPEENLSLCLENVNINGIKSANNKLCIVRKEFRGNSLQCELGRKLESYALESGVGIICATVSPKNTHSIHNVNRLGYTYNRTLSKYGFERNLYYKFI